MTEQDQAGPPDSPPQEITCSGGLRLPAPGVQTGRPAASSEDGADG